MQLDAPSCVYDLYTQGKPFMEQCAINILQLPKNKDLLFIYCCLFNKETIFSITEPEK